MQKLLPIAHESNQTPLFTDWREALMPGCYFVRFVVEPVQLVLYGEVLQSPADGWVACVCHSDRLAQGTQEIRLPIDSLARPLSMEQFSLARHLGWPSGQLSVSKILNVKAN